MRYSELHGKNVKVYFRSKESFEGFYKLDDVRTGELKIVNDEYELYMNEPLLDPDFNKFVFDSPYRFNESQIDSIIELR
jgi:hypothetical protein